MVALLAAGAAQPLPARFESDRVFVTPESANGITLKLYTDTGGGLFLTKSAADRLGLRAQRPSPALAAELGAGATVVAWPRLKRDRSVPPPQNLQMAVFANAQVLPPGWPPQGDGTLGASWFAGRIWIWDYPHRVFSMAQKDWQPPSGAHAVPLGFKASRGVRETNFPRIVVRIDGAPISMLLDTGAETYLSARAAGELGDGAPRMRATSMISASIFSSWRRKHENWPVIEDAQLGTHAAMIRVPDVTVAGYHTGPVWFTWRPDANYHVFMSGMMDRRVEGSIGGNALHRFVMVVDYPGARAWFEENR